MPISNEMQDNFRQVFQDIRESKCRSTLIIESKLRQLCALYRELDAEEREAFLHLLAQEFNVNHDSVQSLAKGLLENHEQGEIYVLNGEEKLRKALTPLYQWLFSQIGRLEGGVKFLVDLRANILAELDNRGKDDAAVYDLRTLNTTLKELLALWFSVGFLNLERVTWDSSCDMLQKVSEYEAVHPMRNWTDLKRRVGPYRRCFVFTHSTMPREPIVVLHTALTDEISRSIQGIVAHRVHSDTDVSGISGGSLEDHRKITTAIFYSITSTQRGLAGIELGNYLIKRVVRQLQQEFPQMNQFSSLSPIPGFTAWLQKEIGKVEKGEPLNYTMFTPEEFDAVQQCINLAPDSENSTAETWKILLKFFTNNAWIQNEKLTRLLELPIMRLVARYLYLEKHRGFALDSVANFHLRNGAVMWRLNWKADLSPRGLSSSCGVMVNYRYYLEDTEVNSARYLDEKYIRASEQVLQLVRQTQVGDLSLGPLASPSHTSTGSE